MGKPCISHIIKYTIECGCSGKKAPNQGPISQSFPIRWVWLSFLMLWEINEKTHAFPMWRSIPLNGNLMEKKGFILWEKYDHQFPWFSPCGRFCCIFLYYGKLMGKPIFSYMMKYIIRWESYREKGDLAMGKFWVPISQFHPIQWVLLHFPVLWEIDGETNAFSILRSIS